MYSLDSDKRFRNIVESSIRRMLRTGETDTYWLQGYESSKFYQDFTTEGESSISENINDIVYDDYHQQVLIVGHRMISFTTISITFYNYSELISNSRDTNTVYIEGVIAPNIEINVDSRYFFISKVGILNNHNLIWTRIGTIEIPIPIGVFTLDEFIDAFNKSSNLIYKEEELTENILQLERLENNRFFFTNFDVENDFETGVNLPTVFIDRYILVQNIPESTTETLEGIEGTLRIDFGNGEGKIEVIRPGQMLVVLYDGYITSTQTSLTVIKPDNSELTINSIRLKAPQVIFNQEYNSPPVIQITFNESVLYPLSNRVYSRGYSCILSDITYPLLGQNYLTISGFRFIDPAEYFRILDQQGNTAVTELSGNLLLDVTPETPTLYYDSSK